ncbi:putative TRAM/LAG1/CLN8 domain-containing protein [Plasmopara halstedii]
MLTEALVVTWINMCAIMLYLDPQLWIVVISSLAFATIRVLILPIGLANFKTFAAMSTFGKLLFSNTLVSMLHSMLSSLLSIIALLSSHSLNGNYVNSATIEEFLATSVSTGYFAHDLWDYVHNGLYVKSPGIILHHVVVLICYTSALTKTVGVPLLSLALLCELHSIFMHARKLLTMSNYSVQQSQLLRWVWCMQWITFIVARVIPHTIVTFLTYQSRDFFHQQLHFVIAFGGMVFINLLNLKLFYDVRKAWLKDFAPPVTSSLLAKAL